MFRFSRHWPAQVRLSFCLAWLVLASTASAELPWSRLDGVYPAGGRAGATLEVRPTGGSELAGATGLWFSHPGLVGKRTVGDPASAVAFEVTVAPDVPPGLYDVRVQSDLGLSNVATFAVGQREEVVEVEPNETAREATAAAVGAVVNGRMDRPTDVDSYRFRAEPGRMLVIDCLATRLDSPLRPVLEVLDARGRRIAFARAGRHDDATLVFDPPEAGEFVLRVYDQTYRGGEQFVYRVELSSDPRIVSVQPVSGPAGVVTKLSLLGVNFPGAKASDQRWRRLTLDEAAADVGFPGDRLSYDRTLPVTPREAGLDSFSWRLETPAGPSQAVRLHFGDAAALQEAEPNNSVSQAQSLKLPAEVSGDFGVVGDVDNFSVDAVKGQPLWIEVFADRLGSPADAALTIDFVADGTPVATRIAAVDDSPSNLLPIGFETKSDDPVYRFEPPANGRCLITLRDQYGQTRGDATLAYRLVVRPPQPDFRVAAVPTSHGTGMLSPASLRRGDAAAMTLVAFRQEGFDGPIEVPAATMGGGLSVAATVIPAGQSTAPLVIRSADEASGEARRLALSSEATVPGPDGVPHPLRRPIRPATTIRSSTKVQGKDVPATVRLAREFVMNAGDEIAPLEVRHEQPRKSVAQGQPLLIPLRLIRRAGAEGPVTLSAQGLAPAAKIESPEVTFAPGETAKQVRLVVRPDAPPQTVVFHWGAKSKVQYQRSAPRVTDGTASPNPVPSSPAQELEVTAVTDPVVLDVRPAPVEMELNPTSVGAVQAGQSTSLTVKLKRKNGFEGVVDVSLFAPVLPDGLSGNTVEVPAHIAETQLVIQSTSATPAGDVENAVIRAVCNGVVVDAPIQLKVLP